MLLTKFGDFLMNVWILAFCIFIEKGIKLQIYLSNLDCVGVTASTVHPLPFIEKYKILQNLIQDDLEASTCSASEAHISGVE